MAGGGAAAAAVAAMAQATKASGVIVKMKPNDFMTILSRMENPLVVTAQGGWMWFGKGYQYLTSYRGLAFYTKSESPLQLNGVELVTADSIWVPNF